MYMLILTDNTNILPVCVHVKCSLGTTAKGRFQVLYFHVVKIRNDIAVELMLKIRTVFGIKACDT